MARLTSILLGVFLAVPIAHAATPVRPSTAAPAPLTIHCPPGPFKPIVAPNQVPPNWTYMFAGNVGTFSLAKAETVINTYNSKQWLECRYTGGPSKNLELIMTAQVPLDSCTVAPGTTDFVCKAGTVPHW
jgi:hypothetical protein